MASWIIPIILAFLIIILLVTLVWRGEQPQPNRQITFSAVGAILSAVLLIVLRAGAMSLPTEADSLTQRTIGAIFLVFGLNAAIQFLRHALTVGVLEKRHIQVPTFVLDLLTWLLVIALAVPLLGALFGLTLTGVLVTSTVVSAVIGLALQDTLGNLISGIALQIESPFRGNEWVEINGHEGQVVQQNWRTLALRTRDNNHILVTNVNVAKSDIINYSRPTGISAQNAHIGVAYHVPPDEAKQVLIQSVQAVEGVVATPAPRVEVMEFADSSINYRVRYWIDDFARKPAISDAVMTRIWYALDRANMTIPFPQRDVHIFENTGVVSAEKQAIALADRVAVLSNMRLFNRLSDEQLHAVAQDATLKRFASGEQLIAEGEPTNALYILQNGAVEMQVLSGEGASRSRHAVEGTFDNGYFGIISLLTNEASDFALVAKRSTNVVTISKSAFANAMVHDPNMLNQLIAAVKARQTQIERGLDAAKRANDQATISGQAALLKRIRGFLGLYG